MIIFLKSLPKRELFALVAILILAAILRFAYPGVNSFAGDEAHISLDALRMARGGEFVMAGQPSSVNIPFFPASVWLFAIPYAFSPDPLVVTWVVSAISLLTVVGVWWLARRWNAWAGLIAALYMATSPYAVFYGRSIWQPNLLAPLSLAWAITAYLGVTRSNRLGKICIGLCVFLGLFVVQVHFAGIALIPATIYLVIRFRWWQKIVPVLIGGALAIAAMMPYVYTITVVDPSILSRFGQVIGGGSAATIDLQGVENLLRLGLGWDWAFLGMGDNDTFSRDLLNAIPIGILLAFGLLAFLLHLLYVVTARRQTKSPALDDSAAQDSETLAPAPKVDPLIEITLLWLIVSPLVFLRHSTPVLIHYQLVELPALALLIGASTLLFQRQGRRTLGVLMITVVMLAAVWSLDIQDTLADTSINRPPNSALSSILRESRDAAYGLQQPVLFFTHGDDPAIDGEAAVFKALLWTSDYRILNGDALLILPPYPATLLATLAPFQAWEEIEASGLANAVQTYPRRIGADPFMATHYDGVSDPQGFTMITQIPFADGTTLIGWRVRRVGDRLRVSTLWQAEADAAPGTYQQFHHLRDAWGGDALAVSDVPLSRSMWRVGDRVIVMADFFKIAPGTTHLSLDIGHYTLPDLTRIPR
ncbi:MAG: hypothetical protein ABI700_06855, partial [Chloroflexota bacterium]